MDTSSLLTHDWAKDAMLHCPRVRVKAFSFDFDWEKT